jgi:hypothetical protein
LIVKKQLGKRIRYCALMTFPPFSRKPNRVWITTPKYQKEKQKTCFSMFRSSSWSLALLLRREASIADGFDEPFCPEKFENTLKKSTFFFEIQIQIHQKHPTTTFRFHFCAKKLTEKNPNRWKRSSPLGHEREVLGVKGKAGLLLYGCLQLLIMYTLHSYPAMSV